MQVIFTLYTGEAPTLLELIHFKKSDGTPLNIMEAISSDSISKLAIHFGITSTKLGHIDNDCKKEASYSFCMIRESFTWWLKRNGSWQSLVQILKDIGENRLADDIEATIVLTPGKSDHK